MIADIQRSLNDLEVLQQKLEAREKALGAREFILTQTQKIARIGSWDFDRATGRTVWSDEMYNIHGLAKDFDTDDYHAVLDLYDDNSRAIMQSAGTSIYQTRKSFDVTARIVTPLGYKKWVRVIGHPVMTGDVITGIMGLTYDISFVKEAVEMLRESEEKFASAFRNSPDLMVITREEDMIIIDVNEKVLPVLGYTREEVVGKSSHAFRFYVQDSDRKKFGQEYRATGQVSMECPWYKKNGDIVHVMISSNRIRLGGIYYFISVIKSISARKLAEEKFQKAFALSPDLMVLIRSRDMQLIDANNKLEEISGYNHSEFIGKSVPNFLQYMNPDDRDKFLEKLVSGTASFASLLYKKNGTTFFGAVTSSTIELGGEPHIICVIRDITEHKKALDKIRDNEINLNAIINNTDMDIWSVDKELKIVALNENVRMKMKKLFDADLCIGLNIIECLRNKLSDADLEQWIAFYDVTLKGGSINFTKEIKSKTFQYSLHPIRLGNFVVGVAGYAKDITEIIRAQEELDAADKQITELHLTTLRAFMNPHFIFNALNSIQFFIANNDRTMAITYLSTFSKLIRAVLTNAPLMTISLGDELEMLRHYVNLEQVRFQNRFDFEVSVAAGIDCSKLMVPSLIIQPFIENSIVHGFSNLKRMGKLRLNIYLKEEYLFIEVVDNGIGRVESKRRKESSVLQYESVGIALTEERLRVINNTEAVVSVEYEDLYDSVAAVGTNVQIKVRISN